MVATPALEFESVLVDDSSGKTDYEERVIEQFLSPASQIGQLEHKYLTRIGNIKCRFNCDT